MKSVFAKTLLLSIFLLIIRLDLAVQAETKIGIDDAGRLGKNIDLGLMFNDEEGNPIDLKTASAGKPIVLAMVYYNCTAICSPFLNGIVDVVERSPQNFVPGENYTLITVSFNPEEGHELAHAKKVNYLQDLKLKQRPVDPMAWRFLTGSKENIDKLSEEVGFYFAPDGKEFKHSTSLIFVSPEGKIARYIKGLSFLPLDVMMAVLDASENRWSPTIKRVIQFCFKKDPEGRKYYFNFLNVVGVMIMGSIVMFFITLTVLIKKGPSQQGNEAN